MYLKMTLKCSCDLAILHGDYWSGVLDKKTSSVLYSLSFMYIVTSWHLAILIRDCKCLPGAYKISN